MPSTNPRDPGRPRLQLSATQLIASALAAITATIAGSYLGINGTVIGAAIASVLTVTGNAVYSHSIHRTRDRVRTVVPATTRSATVPTTTLPAAEAQRPVRQKNQARRLAVAVVAVFAATLGGLTVIEVVAGSPVSDLLRGRSASGTTVFGSTTDPDSTQPAPSVTVTQTVVPKVVTATPTVTQTAPAVTVTPTPTATTTATPTPSPTTSGATTPTGIATP
jgi:hypothetical protein